MAIAVSDPTADLAAIILNWNNSAATIQCARSVLTALADDGCAGVRARLIVVDNGSTPDQLAQLRAWCDMPANHPIELVDNRENLGFARGMNRGIAAARAHSPDFIWLLNNDLEVAAHSISSLLACSRTLPAAVIFGATMVDPLTGRVQAAGGYRYYRWLGYNRALHAGAPVAQLPPTQSVRPDYPDGAALWLRAAFINRVQGLPENRFLYFEELELMQQLQAGETIAWCRDALVYHKGGGSSTTPRLQAFTTYHAALSAFDYTRQHLPWCLPTVILARLVGISLRALRQRNPGLIGAVFRALGALRSPILGSDSGPGAP